MKLTHKKKHDNLDNLQIYTSDSDKHVHLPLHYVLLFIDPFEICEKKHNMY